MTGPHLLLLLAPTAGLAAVLPALAVQVRAKRAALRERDAAVIAGKELREVAERNFRYYEAVVDEVRHLARHQLPALVDEVVRGHPDAAVPGPLHDFLRSTPVPEHHRAVETLLREAVATVREHAAQAARAGVRGIADEAQTLLARLQMKIDEELGKDGPTGAYHQSLTDIDHFTTRALHTVQRLRILAGSWPGMQRANCTIREIVESARGRIGPYDRVEYTYLADVGERYVEGRVVEPVTVALTELLANATDYSSEPVTVYAQQTPTGHRIVVEDTGLGMNAFQRDEAERLLVRRPLLDLTALADERKLGFAVVGRLAHDYHFRVDVGAPSAGGGVKAVLFLPDKLMGEPPADEPAPAPSPQDVPERAGTTTPTPAGLPKRQPRGTRAARTAPPTQEATTDTSDPASLAAGFERLRNAFTHGYGATDSQGQRHDD